jgi:hypothetical protein
MKNLWSKEDLANFNDSEVFKELETRVIDTVKRAEILNRKIAEEQTEQSLKAINEAAKGAADSLAKVDEAAANLADDPEAEEEDDDVTEEVLEELRLLAQEAINKNDIKLAYKIERTIDEISEREIICK